MHFLKDFVGCVGLLTAENDTKAIISTTFGSVDKMLSGQKYPQNARALRLLTEEILVPVFHRYADRLLSMADLEAILTKLSGKSRTTKMWVDLIIKPMFVMMQFSRASHEGDWPLHMITVEVMMSYKFAANHYNYAIYGLCYVRSMERLPHGLDEKFIKGEQTMHHIQCRRSVEWNANVPIHRNHLDEKRPWSRRDNWWHTKRSDNGHVGAQ